jgi:hypothetical protein
VRVVRPPQLVMPGLVPGIHALLSDCCKDVDGRVKPGHDDAGMVNQPAYPHTPLRP